MSDPFEPRTWRLAQGRTLELGPRGHVMGIVNITPDSFSGDGLITSPDTVAGIAGRMIGQGATILDVGAESTRPGAAAIDAKTERDRLMPALAAIMEQSGDTIISIDSYRMSTARAALEAGAHIVNDVWGLQRDPDLARLAADTGAGVVIMHTGRDRDKLADPVEDQRFFLSRSIEIALSAGIAEDRIALDPGFGFAKDADENMTLMARFAALHTFGFPLLVGTSRKRFLGHFTGREVEARDVATAATSALLRTKGAAVLRVHDVAMNVDAVAIADAMLARQRAWDGTAGERAGDV